MKRIRQRLLLVSSCILVQVLCGTALAGTTLEERLQDLGEHRSASVFGVGLASPRLLDGFYRRRDYECAWHTNDQVSDLLSLARDSVIEGLQPSDFHASAIADVVGDPSRSDSLIIHGPGVERLDADILLSDSLLRIIHHRRYGKVDPRHLDKAWNHVDGPFADELAEGMVSAVSAADLGRAIGELTTPSPFYRRLQEGLANYRKIAAEGGWPTVPGGRMLRPGTDDPRIPLIRERLRITGDYLGPEPDSTEYGADLEAAVRRFQQRHHIAVDAVVGPATLAAMNISAEQRADQIRVNLERLRWTQFQLPSDLLLVDIAAQKVRLRRGGEVIWTSRAIVGRESRPTPVFRDDLEYLEINPSWTVPPTILRKDVLPAMRRNSGYLRRKGLQVVTRDGRRVSPHAVNWHTPASRFPYLIRQPPGARNALGRVKFMFPNRFSVYLHDTPEPGLFSKPRRLFSSGCVRVERPWELAELVLNDPTRWTKEQLEALTATSRTRWLRLKTAMPVVLAYWTAEAGDKGEILFREDIYGRDTAVLNALDGTGQLRLVFREPESGAPATAFDDAGKDIPVANRSDQSQATSPGEAEASAAL